MGRGQSRHQKVRESTDRDLIQELKSIVRRQRKEIQTLRKELGKREDVSEEYRDLLEEVDRKSESDAQKVESQCSKCGKGKTSTKPLGKYHLEVCSNCDHRKLIK